MLHQKFMMKNIIDKNVKFFDVKNYMHEVKKKLIY